MKLNLLAILGLIISFPSYSAQYYCVEDNQDLKAHVSAQHLNRIYLENDRVANIHTLDGQFQIQHDADTGDLYLKPDAGYQDETMHLFIKSEQGFSYSLTLLSDSTTPQAIALANSNAKAELYNDETNKHHKDEINQLLSSMFKGEGNDLVVKQELDQNNAKILRKQLTLSHQANFWGTNYFGEKLMIVNDSKESVVLHESDLVDKHTIQLVLLAHQLAKGEYTFAYRIKKHDK